MITLPQLKRLGGSRTKPLVLYISEYEGIRYITNSYYLANVDKVAHLWADSNLQCRPGCYVVTTSIRPQVGTPPNLSGLVPLYEPQHLVSRAEVAHRPAYLQFDEEMCMVWETKKESSVVVRKDFSEFVVGAVERDWPDIEVTAESPTKPVAFWHGHNLVGLVMPVLLP